jgi:hypothetical protein
MAFAGGAAIFGVFIVAFTLAVIYGLYTRRGSGINQRPYQDVYNDATGARGPSQLAHDYDSFSHYSRGTR